MRKEQIILPVACLFTTFLLLVCFPACLKDMGNYHYQAREQVTVGGIQTLYSVFRGDSLCIDPQIFSTSPDTAFAYSWSLNKNIPAEPETMDTISHSRQLCCRVTLGSGVWTLIFSATNTKTLAATTVNLTLLVNTNFSQGWYVLKDNGGSTDIDFFPTPETIVPSGRIEEVLYTVNGQHLDGQAASLALMPSYSTTVNEAYYNTRALMALSENDAVVLDLNNGSIINKYDSLFFEPPVERKLQRVFYSLHSYFLVNNGRLHTLYSRSINTGKFGYQQLLDNRGTAYSLSKFYMTYWSQRPVFFDQRNSCFVTSEGTATMLTPFLDDAKSAMPACGNNKSLLYLGLKAAVPYEGCAVFSDKTNPELKIITSMRLSGMSQLLLTNDTLTPSSAVYHASLFAMLMGEESLLYFVKDHELWNRSLLSKQESRQYSFPTGEEPLFIQHRKYTGTTNYTKLSHNFIIAASAKDNVYTIRMFGKSAGNILPMPAVTLQGKGRPVDVIFVSPDITLTTPFYN
ncbi:PKD-like family lipoprotein [Filimonas effusa]|uniref:PKD domain-containing protein n=1 Tax=Filimonas effusa TaxID=2508721 RepID=A0A4Q1CZL5_9BACT|nr:PKD-like family lipoprotein [Filimonas effusa]RXK80833.1 hypothetical protein ESB13_22005 [Filimonas effusa]